LRAGRSAQRESAPVVLVYPYGIVVDCSGRRFFDEGAGLVHETWEAFARDVHFNRPGGRSLRSSTGGCSHPGLQRAIRSEVPPVQADTLDALARDDRRRSGGLADTVARYNAACTGDASRFDATLCDGLAADARARSAQVELGARDLASRRSSPIR
jgi:tricarballylate dehydrogenase